MSRGRLLVVVSLSGASVLVLEILGSRVLGPSYGVSLFLWSALIGVTLAALAAGYAVGGRIADRHPDPARLSLLLALAGLWVALMPWLRGPVVALADGLGPRAAVLTAAALLFFPPLFLLGMVSPFAIRLSTREVGEVGRVSGDLFAVSTLASVVAAVLTGFTLIPVLGVNRLLAAVALALFAAAALTRLGGIRGTLLLIAGAALALGSAAGAGRPVPGVLARVDSPYAELRVVESRGLRYLLIDGGPHTIVDAKSGAPRQAYAYAAEIAAIHHGGRGRALLVGLGGGGAARLFSERGWEVDAVELDRDVAALAVSHFGLRPYHARVHVAEGRRFLQRSTARWDVVVLDAFGSASIPFHLVTREAFAAAKARLAPGGTLALNVETVGWQDPLVHALSATLRTEFREVWALPTAEPPDRLGNVVLLASDTGLELDLDRLGDPVTSLEDEDEHFGVLSRRHAWANRYRAERGRVLTDDWNPVDLRADEVNRAARRALRETLPDSLLGG